MSEELIKRLEQQAAMYAGEGYLQAAALLREAIAGIKSRPAPASAPVPEGIVLVNRDEAIRVLEGVANIVHVCWSEWGAAGSWSDYDQSVMEGMHALQAKLAAARESGAQECMTHGAAIPVVPKAMYDQLMSNYIALSNKPVAQGGGVDALREVVSSHIEDLRRCAVALRGCELAEHFIGTADEFDKAAVELESALLASLAGQGWQHYVTMGKTARGFDVGTFFDRYGVECSIQKSSLADEDCIWLGCDHHGAQILASKAAAHGVETSENCGWVPYPLPDAVSVNTRMHLTKEQVAALLPMLQHFAAHGDLPSPPAIANQGEAS